MSEALFALGPQGKLYLEKLGSEGIMLERERRSSVIIFWQLTI
jgi:hypothetical protein